MDTPGAFETKATEAFYYVTPPEVEWEVKRKVEHMRQFNKTALDNDAKEMIFLLRRAA